MATLSSLLGSTYVGGLGASGATGVSNVPGATGPAFSTTVGSTGITSGTIAPNSSFVQYSAIGLTGTTVIDTPSGSPVDGQKLTIRIKDSGSARSLSFTTSAGGYRVIGTVLPTTTVAGKNTYIVCVYNSTDGYWDVVAVTTEA
jgi:hypothetical protein